MQRLRAEFELISPSSSASDEWSAASELAEVEKLASLGILLKPRELPTKRNKLKAALANPSGRLVFADSRDEFEGYGAGAGNAEAGPSRPRRVTPAAYGSEGGAGVEMDGEGGEEAEEEGMDLGWEDTPQEAKRKIKKQREKERAAEGEEVDEEEQAEEIRVCRELCTWTFDA